MLVTFDCLCSDTTFYCEITYRRIEYNYKHFYELYLFIVVGQVTFLYFAINNLLVSLEIKIYMSNYII